MEGKVQYLDNGGGERLVVLEEKHYRSLLRAAEDAADVRAAREGLASLNADGGVPAAVVYKVLDGMHPLVAWREYRGLTQAALAEAAGLTQAAIARLEQVPPGSGRRATREALCRSLGAPAGSLDRF